MRYERQNYPRVGKALIFLGSLLYGAGIWLIAQIYNIKEHYPNGILLWIIGVLPMAYMISSESILSLTLLLSTLWLGLEFMYAPTGGFNEFTAHEFIALYVIYGVFLYAIGLIQSQTRRFSNLKRPYLMLGAVIALLLFYPLTFETISRELSRSGQSVKKFSELWIGIPILTVLSFILIFVSIALKREKDKMFLAEAGGLLGVLFLALFTLLYPEVSLNYVVSNTIFILIILGVLALGYYKHIPSLVNVGSFFFGLEVVTRYFDWFWDLLPKSLFFIVGGVILLIGGIHLERRRRKVIESMRGYVGT
jgi:uncharacterized membrane protein